MRVKESLEISDLSKLELASKWLIKRIEGIDHVAFYGDMGAGKTTLIQEICRLFGVRQAVTSPTFALVNEYTGLDNQIIYHFDFYRLDNPEEVLDIGFEDYVSSGNRCFMEWPEKIEPYLPPNTLKVFIEVKPDNSRKIWIDN